MKLIDQLNCVMRKGVKPKILATLIETPLHLFTARELAERASCSASAARRAAEDLALARFITSDAMQPRHYWMRLRDAENWTRLFRGEKL